jgi:hypothetical protein
MQRLSLNEVLLVTDTPINEFKALRIRKQLALAFGRSDAYASLSYVELDGVGLLLADALAESHGRQFAAHAVRVYWDIWGFVVARAEADPSQAAKFCIVDFMTKSGKAANLVCGAGGVISDEEIAAQLAATPQAAGAEATRIVCVNLTRLIRFMRENGARHGINLMGPFLPWPDDQRTIDLLAPWTEARARAIEMVGAMTAKDEKAATRAGTLARSALEAYLPKPEGVTVQ